jgi:hypothetical protein
MLPPSSGSKKKLARNQREAGTKKSFHLEDGGEFFL